MGWYWAGKEGKRPCDCCGRKIRVQDIGEVRTIYPTNRRFVWCMNCYGGVERKKDEEK